MDCPIIAISMRRISNKDYTITVNVTAVPPWKDKNGNMHAGEGKVHKNYKELGLVKGYGVVRYGVGESEQENHWEWTHGVKHNYTTTVVESHVDVPAM